MLLALQMLEGLKISVFSIQLWCRFYTECLGMKLLRKRDIPEEKYTNAFLGYGPEDTNFVVELTYSKCVVLFDLCAIKEAS